MGNGRSGAMMFGGIDDERIVLNESSLWSGSPQDADRPDAYKVPPEISPAPAGRSQSRGRSAGEFQFHLQRSGSGGGQYGCYQVLGNLHLTFRSETNSPVEAYRRELNLNDAVTRMTFKRNGVTFSREMFVSAPGEVMILRLTADKAGQISFATTMDLTRSALQALLVSRANGLLMNGPTLGCRDCGQPGREICSPPESSASQTKAATSSDGGLF